MIVGCVDNMTSYRRWRKLYRNPQPVTKTMEKKRIRARIRQKFLEEYWRSQTTGRCQWLLGPLSNRCGQQCDLPCFGFGSHCDRCSTHARQGYTRRFNGDPMCDPTQRMVWRRALLPDGSVDPQLRWSPYNRIDDPPISAD